MAGPIIANSGSIRATGTKFTAASVETTRLLSTMQALVGRLGGTWTGQASSSFQTSMGQVKAQLDLAVNDLRDTGQSLNEAAAAYEQYENAVKGRVAQVTV